MAFLETKYQKKSFVITSILYVLIILFLFFAGLKYLDPPPESGIAINFGTTDYGSGEVQPTQPVKTAPKQNIPEPTPQETTTTTEAIEEDVATQEEEEAPVIEKKEEPKKTKEKPVEQPKEQPKEEVKSEPKEEPVEEIPEKEPDPQPDESAVEAMKSMLAGKEKEGEDQAGEGDDAKAGDKGDPGGDPNANSYYGQGTGTDGDGNYKLGGRKALAKTKYIPDCNETGEVHVRIEVNQEGKVIRAEAGVQGTTNSSQCLLEPAERAARNTTFNNDPNAPSRQVGKIIYVFKLSE